ncbi:MAG: DUF2330 domain-containing protein [Acidobacteria bacterium]|nr:DUF2330 domain-containing protein [Acidobacteriota bacterium]
MTVSLHRPPAVLGLFWCLLAPVAADGYVVGEWRLAERPSMSTQRAVVVHRDGAETLLLESPFRGKGDRFGWLVPVPAEPSAILPVDGKLFDLLFHRFQPAVRHGDGRGGWFFIKGEIVFAALMAPILFFLYRERISRLQMLRVLLYALPFSLLVMIVFLPAPLESSHSGASGGGALAEPELKRLKVGVYDTAILRPRNASQLQAWLSRNGYSPLTPDGERVTEAVIRDGWLFVASRLQRETPGAGGDLQPHPLEIRFPSRKPVYPLRLTALASTGLDLDLLVVADGEASAQGLETLYVSRFALENATERVLRGLSFSERIGNPILVLRGWDGCCVTRMQGSLNFAQLSRDLSVDVSDAPSGYRRTIYTEPEALRLAVGYPLTGFLLTALALTILGWDDWLNGRRQRAYLVAFLAAAGLAAAGGAAWYRWTVKIPADRVVKSRSLNRGSGIAMLRNLASAEKAYRETAEAGNGAYGTLRDLARANFLDQRFLDPVPEADGFTYQITLSSGGYTIRAFAPDAGPEWEFFITEQEVVRLPDGTEP